MSSRKASVQSLRAVSTLPPPITATTPVLATYPSSFSSSVGRSIQ
ncbi:hypothetical protein ACWEJ6_53885 [Nonomuraea sp. NPDC004702]